MRRFLRQRGALLAAFTASGCFALTSVCLVYQFLDKHRDAVNEVRLPVYLNLAACYLNRTNVDFAKVIENADLALAIDPQNTKALYRGGKAHLLLDDLDAAKKKLTLAAKNQPSDKNIREVRSPSTAVFVLRVMLWDVRILYANRNA